MFHLAVFLFFVVNNNLIPIYRGKQSWLRAQACGCEFDLHSGNGLLLINICVSTIRCSHSTYNALKFVENWGTMFLTLGTLYFPTEYNYYSLYTEYSVKLKKKL